MSKFTRISADADPDAELRYTSSGILKDNGSDLTVHTDQTHSNTGICQLVTSAHVVSEIVRLAQHKHNDSTR